MSNPTEDQPRNVFALILAGGSGTRFWPLSREQKPKQLLSLFDEETLIEKSVSRLQGLVPPENILVLTNAVQEEAVRSVLPELPEENIVSEPARRDTAPAIALAAGWVAARDPEAVMAVLPADQLVTDAEGFRSILNSAIQVAGKTDAIITLGIRPDWACPSYGYIERGEEEEIEGISDPHLVCRVLSFREKPKPEVAEAFLEQGNFCWNAGIFVWSLPTLLGELSQHCPELAQFIETLRKAESFADVVEKEFAGLTKISIDFALMERAKKVLTIEADVGWDDVGGWPSVSKYLETDESGNSMNTNVISENSANNIVFSTEKECRIALLGVDDLIVVQTGDAILVAKRSEADRIKGLVDRLPKELL